MRTRDDLTEAREVVRVLSLYGALLFQQILALFPGRAETVRNMIARLIKQKRLFYIEDCCAVAISPKKQLDAGMVSAFWVLLDFLDQVDFHTASDFPIAISFFTEAGDAYDIVTIAPGQENTIYYKDLRVVIPVSEMMIQLSTEPNNYGEMAERQNKILNNMLGCEVDFVVRGIDARTRSVVASRREAMLRKRKTFYLQPDLN